MIYYPSDVYKRQDYRTLIESPLYPDQMVFLIGTLFENKPELAEGEASVEFRTCLLYTSVFQPAEQKGEQSIMKAVAVGDLLLPASVFDETIRSASRCV